MLVFLTALAALVLSLYASAAILVVRRNITRRLVEVEQAYKAVKRQLTVIGSSLARALESVEAENAIRLLARRRRRRYIVFFVVSDGGVIEPNSVEEAILRAVERLGGQLTVALGSIRLVYYHPEKKAGIIAATHDTKYLVLAAMGLVRRIGESRVVLVPVKTTGTVRRAKKSIGLPLRELR